MPLLVDIHGGSNYPPFSSRKGKRILIKLRRIQEMEERKYFTFLKSYADIYQQLSNDQKVAFIDAIIEHQLGDSDVDNVAFNDVLLNVAWSGVKHSLARSKAQYLNGKKPKRSQTEANVKPNPSNKEVRSKKKEIRSKNKEVESIDTFVPNATSMTVVNSVHPNCDVSSLVDNFKDQARNREKPFKDLQSGFRNYVNKGWVKPIAKQEKSFAQMANETESPWDENGRLIGLKDDGTFENETVSVINGLSNKLRIM